MSDPLHGPNAYESQFGDRIRQIRKGGNDAPPAAGPGCLSGAGRGGWIIVVVVVGLLRFFMAMGNSGRDSCNYPPPQVQPMQVPRFMLDPPPERPDVGKIDELNARLRDLMKQRIIAPNDPFQKFTTAGVLLTIEDVPLPRAFCYFLSKRGQEDRNSTLGRLYTLLSADEQNLVRRLVEVREQGQNDINALIAAINRALEQEVLIDPNDQQGLLRVQMLQGEEKRRTVQRINRRQLDMALPLQVAPFGKPLDVMGREQLKSNALKEWINDGPGPDFRFP